MGPEQAAGRATIEAYAEVALAEKWEKSFSQMSARLKGSRLLALPGDTSPPTDKGLLRHIAPGSENIVTVNPLTGREVSTRSGRAVQENIEATTAKLLSKVIAYAVRGPGHVDEREHPAENRTGTEPFSDE
ncbi:hypothetical protein AC578_834 [Pseudocercospora eumusae]|uniref:Uncharacterized protein n=1 Tax=Pseudocercospora eumusae TaxID=321146 RepID=A0A139GZU9_9PEZI|nr:hypothetical protein AC578_834 [Pseudocercospora eumusae]